jgi:predicted RNA-binding protein with PIN domain
MHVIVDAYNLIMTSAEYGAIKGARMQGAREGLVRDMVRYKKVRGHRVTLVFDATESGGIERTVDKRDGVNVIFTRRDETADDVIIEIVERGAGTERVVVTSDVAVMRGAKRRGAAVITSEGFLRKMEIAFVEDGVEDKIVQEGFSNYRSRKRISLDKL